MKDIGEVCSNVEGSSHNPYLFYDRCCVNKYKDVILS